jgi:hypothetical protein
MPKQKPEGVLFADAMYTREQLARAVGLGPVGLTQARASGLVCPVEISKRHLYYGREVIAYLLKLRDDQRASHEKLRAVV